MEEIYEPLNKSLQLVGALMDAAETHGILCGLLCMPQSFSKEEWLRHILGEAAFQDGLASECERQLLLLKEYTLDQLNTVNYEFMPLLPDNDIVLSERVQALGGWCEGFLYGLGLTNIETENLSDNSEEFVNDVLSISRVAYTSDENEENEENEESYMQLVEYIKVGVITLNEEVTIVDEEYEQQ
jgi:yecA family protein